MPRSRPLDGGPTQHFTWDELGQPPSSLRANARHLAEHLERLRKIAGGEPMWVLSGYRTPAHNRMVGGAKRSQHLSARAADLPSGRYTVEEAEKAGFTGIGSSGPWAVHVDVRPGPAARWRY